jgi:hypothetical protein
MANHDLRASQAKVDFIYFSYYYHFFYIYYFYHFFLSGAILNVAF